MLIFHAYSTMSSFMPTQCHLSWFHICRIVSGPSTLEYVSKLGTLNCETPKCRQECLRFISIGPSGVEKTDLFFKGPGSSKFQVGNTYISSSISSDWFPKKQMVSQILASVPKNELSGSLLTLLATETHSIR